MVLAQPLPGIDLETERIQRARLGDSEALHELMTSHRALVQNVARRYVSDHDDLEDVAQETWIRAAKALGSLKDESRFRPWLRSITRNACLTFLASRKPSDSLDDDDADEPADRASEGPEAATEQRDDRRRVWEALGALPELDRRALFLREVESLPFEEVARRLGVRKNAAEVRVHRARTKFRQLYEATDAVQPPCGMAGIRLALLLDHELHGEPAAVVEQHLEACTDCRLRIRTMAQGRSLYRRMGMFGLPGLVGLVERLQRAVDALMRTIPAEAVPLLASQGGTPAVAAVAGITTVAVAAAALAAVPAMAGALPSVAPMVDMSPPAAAGALLAPDAGVHTPVLIMSSAWTPPTISTPTVPASASATPQTAPTETPRAAARPVATPAASGAETDSFPADVAAAPPAASPVAGTPGPAGPATTTSDAPGTIPSTPSASTPKSDDDKGGKASSAAAKDDDRGGKGNSAAAKDDDKSGKGNSAAAKDDDKSGKGNSAAAKDDDKGGKGNSVAAKDDDKGATGNSAAAKDDDKGGKGNSAADKDDDKGGKGSGGGKH